MGVKSFWGNQVGAASIYVSISIMTILVLMAISFAGIINNSHAQTLEGQLSVQASYAAETGINDARLRLLKLVDAYNRGDHSFFDKEIDNRGVLPHSSISPTLNDNDRFGDSLIVSDDHKMLVGAPGKNTVYPFELDSNGNWTSSGSNLSPSVSEFGRTLALKKDCLFVADASDSVYAYKYDDSSLSWTAATPASIDDTSYNSATDNQFGFSLAVNANFLAVGAYNADSGVSLTENGVVYLYEYDSSDCNIDINTVELLPGSTSGDHFGYSVTLNDNNLLAVGAPDTVNSSITVGAVHIYEYDASDPTNPWVWQLDKEGDTLRNERNFGHSVSLNSNSFLAVSVKDNTATGGSVYVYHYKFDTSAPPERVLEGYLYVSESYLADATIVLNNRFLAIGVPGHNSSHGIVRVYEYKSSPAISWNNEVAQSPQLGADVGDEFGKALSLSGNFLLVGAPGYDNTSNNNVGTVYMLNMRPLDLTDDVFSDLLNVNCVSEDLNNPPEDQYNFNIDDQIHYSCIDIELNPDLLYYDKIYSERSLNILLKTVKKDNLGVYRYRNMKRLDITWVNDEANDPPDFDAANIHTGPYPEFPVHADWNYDAPVLRMQVTALDTTDGYDRSLLNNNTKVFYLYPSLESSSLNDWGVINDGDIIKGSCDTGDKCTASITDLPNFITPNHNDKMAFFVSINSLYRVANVDIAGYDDNNGQPADRIKFKDVQAIIGATGHASTVQVRLEERVRLQPTYDHPEYAIHSATTICKVLIGDQDRGTDHDVPTLPSDQQLIGRPPGITIDDCRVY